MTLLVEKEGEKFELRSRLFEHAAHNGSNYLDGHCMVSILLSFPVLADGSIRYLSVPLGCRIWDKKQTKLETAAGMVRQVMGERVVYALVTLPKSGNGSRRLFFCPKDPESILLDYSRCEVGRCAIQFYSTTGRPLAPIM